MQTLHVPCTLPTHSRDALQQVQLCTHCTLPRSQLHSLCSLTRWTAGEQVQLCKHVRTGETVVLKIIKKQWVLDAHQLDHVKEENATMMQLSAHDCPFVVKTLGSFQVMYSPWL